ncbi:MAG: right-handed parallel beta-helix repeat-containing protein, partial [Clostridia bacterium]|nr:right-handed parallel beta-helix repeat-containing protein [Clostridia bacterium]
MGSIKKLISIAVALIMCMQTQVLAEEIKSSFGFNELDIVYNNAQGELIRSAYGVENLFVTPYQDGLIEFNIPVEKGSHTLILNAVTGDNRGIFSVFIDGEEKTDKINLYNEYIEEKTFVLGSVKLLSASTVNIRLVSAGKDNNSTAQLGVFKSVEYVDNKDGEQYLSVVKQRIEAVPSVTHPLYNYKNENIMATIYVDSVNGSDENPATLEKPLKTLIAAQKKVREINRNMTGDIEVVLRDGIYTEARSTRPYKLYDKPINKEVDGETPRELRETIDVTTSQFSLNSQDSASNGYRIIYRAYEGEKPVISGENVISGWELYDEEKNIYRAPSQGIKTRSLYVNGERANRARTEINTDNFHGLFNNVTVDDNGLTTDDDYFLNWKNLDRVELVFIDPGWWAPRVKIHKAEKIGDKTVITLKQPAWYFNRNKNHMSIAKGPAYMENAYELLDKSGEWYLDEESFYYKPHDGEDINSLNITAGVVEELFKIEGTHDKPIGDISFKGITFRGTTWLRPETDNGFADSQSNGIREDNGSGRYDEMPLAAVSVSWADRIEFRECSFENLGSNGLFIDKGSHNCLIIGNNVYDVSGTGIVIGGVGMEYRTVTDEREKIVNCDVVSNRITRCAQEYYSGVGLSLGMPNDTDVIYNEISDCTYSGMHIGWSFYTEPEKEAMPALFVNTKI